MIDQTVSQYRILEKIGSGGPDRPAKKYRNKHDR